MIESLLYKDRLINNTHSAVQTMEHNREGGSPVAL